MTGDRGAIVEHVDSIAHAQERLTVWADTLRNLGLAQELGAFVACEAGSGWIIRVARHDGLPLRVVVVLDDAIPQQRNSNEGEL